MSQVIDFNDLDRFAADGVPHAWFTELRATDPLFRSPESGADGYWVLTRYEDIVSASRDWRTFSSDNANGGIVGLTEAHRRRRIDNLVENTFVTMDPPEHTKHRNVVVRALLPRAVADCEPFFRQKAADLIEAAKDQESVDFVTRIAVWLPLEMLAELGNIPALDRAKVLKWVNAMLAPDDPEYASSFDEALQCRRAMQEYCRGLYALRKENPGHDAISLMIEGVIDEKPVSAANAKSLVEREPTMSWHSPVRISSQHFGTIPRVYIECEFDNAIPLSLQRSMQRDLPCAKTWLLKTDHSPFYSDPDALVHVLTQTLSVV
jgi:cytochrome P450